MDHHEFFVFPCVLFYTLPAFSFGFAFSSAGQNGRVTTLSWRYSSDKRKEETRHRKLDIIIMIQRIHVELKTVFCDTFYTQIILC